MKRIIKKFYTLIYGDDGDQSYRNKVILFYLTIIISTAILLIIVKGILINIPD